MGRDELEAMLTAVTADTAKEALARATALLRHEPDPRIAEAVFGWLKALPYHATGAQPFWRAAFALLEKSAAPAMGARLAKLDGHIDKTIQGASMKGWMRTQVAKLAKKVAAGGGARIAAGSDDDGQALLDAVRANPDDDGPRAVYADWLSERGDPRGELIALQLAKTPLEPKAKARVETLVRKHFKAWAGELAPYIIVKQYQLATGPEPSSGKLRFDRGFVAECTIVGRPAALRGAIGNPTLATVEALTITHDDAALVLELVHHPVMRALHTLTVDPEIIPKLVESPIAARLRGLSFSANDGDLLSAAVERLKPLPVLRALSLTFFPAPIPPSVDALARALGLRSLERLDFHYAGVVARVSRPSTDRPFAIHLSLHQPTAELTSFFASLAAVDGLAVERVTMELPWQKDEAVIAAVREMVAAGAARIGSRLAESQ